MVALVLLGEGDATSLVRAADRVGSHVVDARAAHLPFAQATAKARNSESWWTPQRRFPMMDLARCNANDRKL